MAFTHAIYYPWIDIKNASWLKTAILYWDKISTIVPGNMEEPYKSPGSAYLFQEEILVPNCIEPWHPAVNQASRCFLDYIRTPEARAILLPRGTKKGLRIPSINDSSELAKLNKWKIDEELAYELKASGKVVEDGEWLIFDRQYVDYYMTLLTAILSGVTHYAPLTDNGNYEPLINRAKRGDNPNRKNQELGEALLAQIIIDTLQISPDTPFETIVDFRHNYRDEIGQFRFELGRLAREGIDPETPTFRALQQQVNDIHINRIQPAVRNLEKALRGRRIRTFVTHLASIIFSGAINNFLFIVTQRVSQFVRVVKLPVVSLTIR